MPVPSLWGLKGACVSFPGHKVCLHGTDGTTGKKGFTPCEVGIHFILQSHKIALHFVSRKQYYCSVLHWDLFDNKGFGLLIFSFLCLVCCFRTLICLDDSMLLLYLNLCWENCIKPYLFRLSQGLMYFFKGLIYSEFKNAEKSIITEWSVARQINDYAKMTR